LTLTGTDGRTWSPGGGLIEIKNGILSVSNKGRTLKDVDSSTDKFDTFEGQIDKNGDFMATFEFNACGPGDCEEEIIVLEGNINNNSKLTGIFLDKVIAFELTKVIDIKSIETSNTFDGSYYFTLKQVKPGEPILGTGYGSLEINAGTVTVKKGSKKYGDGPNFYDSFNGKIDKNGDIVASFHFSACSQCGLVKKSAVFNGNIKNLKISGMYDDLEIIFDMR